MEEFISLITLGASLSFILYYQNKNNKFEIERFREFVKANKSRDLPEYLQSIPEEEQEKEVKDEIVELSELSPEELLKAIKE